MGPHLEQCRPGAGWNPMGGIEQGAVEIDSDQLDGIANYAQSSLNKSVLAMAVKIAKIIEAISALRKAG